MEKIKLDKKDRRILYELEKNFRQPTSVIAKNVGLSREVVNYRIHQLEKKKVIEYYVTVIDYVKLGYTFCRVWFKYHMVSKKIEDEIIAFARKSPSINWVVIGDGLYNMVIIFLVKDMNAINEEFDKFKDNFGNHIIDIVPSIAFNIYHFKHTFLYDNDDRTPVIIGKEKREKVSENNLKMLKILSEKPRISYVDLAKTLGKSSKTISKKVQELIKRGIIKQFKAKVNTNILGYEHQKVLLYFRDQNSTTLNTIIAFLKQEPRIIFITKPFATAGLEFEIIVKGRRELFEFLQILMANYSDKIKDYNVCLIYKEPFSKYLLGN